MLREGLPGYRLLNELGYLSAAVIDDKTKSSVLFREMQAIAPENKN
jgi:hypothetical protein